MRAPLQILAIPYKIENGIRLFCVLHRSDINQWQFIAGGGEDHETPDRAARREILEESGIEAENIVRLTSMSYVPASCISERHRINSGRRKHMSFRNTASHLSAAETLPYHTRDISDAAGLAMKKPASCCTGIQIKRPCMN